MTLTLIGHCPMSNSSELFSYTTICSSFKWIEPLFFELSCTKTHTQTLRHAHRWASLYKGVPLNDPSFDNDFIRTILSQKNIITPELDTEILNRHITKQEIKEAVDSSKNGKAVSVDKLPNEIFKNPMSICILYELFNFCFVNALIPNLWRKSLISPIFKGKGKDPRNPLSYRPMALICNPCKFYANILNKRLLKYVELNEVLVEEQNGF